MAKRLPLAVDLLLRLRPIQSAPPRPGPTRKVVARRIDAIYRLQLACPATCNSQVIHLILEGRREAPPLLRLPRQQIKARRCITRLPARTPLPLIEAEAENAGAGLKTGRLRPYAVRRLTAARRRLAQKEGLIGHRLRRIQH